MKRWTTALYLLILCGALSACGHYEQAPDGKESEASAAETGSKAEAQTESSAGEENGSEDVAGEYRPIQDQTFDVELTPLGTVTFTSYEPAGRHNPLSDALFKVEKDGENAIVLEAVEEDNVRGNMVFNSVEAVSFPDYNNDGFSDIIIICSYSPASGPEVGTGHSEARIYSGSKEGSFTLERELSENANSAVAEMTVKSVLGYLGAEETKAAANAEWKQAYLDHLQSLDPGEWTGYQLIYVDGDEIPELAKIGISEATGSAIVTYGDGTLHETRMMRLYFTYIEKGNLLCNAEGNMDRYYDLVYLLKEGRLTQIAAGYYGWEDDSRGKFDANGVPVYQYKWNDTVMSETEYEKALNEIYDTSKAKPGYEWDHLLSLEDVIQKINSL